VETVRTNALCRPLWIVAASRAYRTEAGGVGPVGSYGITWEQLGSETN
jgi:hypothetical protein